MADDLGFSDIGCYGSEIPTPNLDALAAGGVRLTQFYNTSRCCPSRASLLTGLYSHQAGIGAMNNVDEGPGYRGQLLAATPTLPEMLRKAGYGTAMVGKWHLTLSKTIDDGPNGSWPFQRGFDRFYGTMEGAKSYFRPQWLFEGKRPITDFPDDYFYTTAIARRAAQFIREHPGDRPLFLYVAFYAPHFPLQAPAEAIAGFRGKYMAGWDRLRHSRHERQLTSGVIPERTPLSRRTEGVPPWETLTPAQKDGMDLRMAIYAAQVHLLDEGVGHVVEGLRESGRLDDTLLLFLSDNGATDVGGPFGAGSPETIGTPEAELVSTYGAGWANLSNTPYRLFKADTHEGGVRAPLILHWPNRLREKNSFRHSPAHIIDIVPTCLAAAGIQPDDVRSQSGPGLEGRSLLELADGTPERSPRPLFFEHLGSRAVRFGRWKLVSRKNGDAWELYDLESDRTEENNLATERPEVVQQLNRRWREWAKRCSVRGGDN